MSTKLQFLLRRLRPRQYAARRECLGNCLMSLQLWLFAPSWRKKR